MVKRRTMDDVFARMGEMNAARANAEPETAPAVEAQPARIEPLALDPDFNKNAAAWLVEGGHMTRDEADRMLAETDAKAKAHAENPPPRRAARSVRSIATETAAEPASAPGPILTTITETEADAGPMVAPLRDGTPVAFRDKAVSTRARSHVEKERIAKETRPAKVPKGFNVRPPRIEQPHQSVYADPAVFKVIRQIALAEDVKPQDLYREALRMMLKKRGYDFDKLNRGEV